MIPLRKTHDTAVIYPGANVARDAMIGPYAVIGPNVTIGSETKVGPHVVVDGWTYIGRNCSIHAGAVIGGEPQDLKFAGEKSYVYIGDNCTIRECVTINRATGEGSETRLGNNVLLMATTHIAHNCIVGNNVIMSNGTGLAGHVVVEDRAVIGGLAGIHQFVKVGRNAMVGGMAKITQDVPPFVIVDGNPAFVAGLNSVGIARAGVSPQVRRDLKKAYKILYRAGYTLEQAIAEMEQELTSGDEIDHLLRFLRNVERGICRNRKCDNNDV
jgi:UDP-N-acetylglucosamine acyltransferase